eukprot:TRINITY_DN12182_c0_g1_i1.p1 TRINITY_DN12182_c0_g1~~TRINITY_DN12182_c0_g1_i1.p1  ORF type:complete len:156 (-),score=58.44 TRINITY_DN12182_c0_g1_i1:21-425(-)
MEKIESSVDCTSLNEVKGENEEAPIEIESKTIVEADQDSKENPSLTEITVTEEKTISDAGIERAIEIEAIVINDNTNEKEEGEIDAGEPIDTSSKKIKRAAAQELSPPPTPLLGKRKMEAGDLHEAKRLQVAEE